MPHIYGRELPASVITYNNMSAELKEYIDNWSYHNIQQNRTNNCTLSSYNMGISVRHGIEFFDWLLNKERQLAPSFNTKLQSHTHQIVRGTRLGGSSTTSVNDNISAPSSQSYTHTELMRKFQKELRVEYSQVLNGIVVEQNLVEMAGINTVQTGASFRRHDDSNTVFNFKLSSNEEVQRFVNYYNNNFPGLITSVPSIVTDVRAVIIMNTRILHNQVASALSEFAQKVEQDIPRSNMQK